MAKFSKDLTHAIGAAADRASADKAEFISLEYLLWALIQEPEVKDALRKEGLRERRLEAGLDRFLRDQTGFNRLGEKTDPRPTIGVERVINRAADTLVKSNSLRPLNCLDVLVAIEEDEDSDAAFFLKQFGIRPSELTQTDDREISQEQPEDEGGAVYARCDIWAANDAFDPLVGRQEEIDRLILAFSRKIKSSALIVGERGVGKTTLAQGIARLIAQDLMPDRLKGMKFCALNFSALKSGCLFYGDLTKRFRDFIDSVTRDSSAIVFLDDMHKILNGSSADEFADLLAMMLAHPKIHVLGASTHRGLRTAEKNISSLISYFQKIDLRELSAEDSLKILSQKRKYFESFHHVKYSDEILSKIVKLSEYVSNGKLPDKAVDIMDEAGAIHYLSKSADPLVTTDEVERVIAKLARIPEQKVSESGGESLRNLSGNLKKVIFGQDHAIDAVVNAIKLSKSGLADKEKLIGSFLLAGPTGVGKTELAKQVAKQMGMEFIRFDMSEYSEEYSVSKLLGSAPGYVGYQEGGRLTEAVSRTPHAVLLLDEIEKAHPAIYNVLLQVMDYGMLTDSSGKTVDFRNILLLMTTNAGAADYEKRTIGFDSTQGAVNGARGISAAFAPEFRNRLDEVLHFNRLGREQVALVADKLLKELSRQLAEKNISMTYTEALKAHLIAHGFDPLLGARPMISYIQRSIKRELANEMLFGRLQKKNSVTIDADEKDQIRFVYEHE